MQVITSHANTDLDGLASMVGASRLYPEALMVFPGAVSVLVQQFMALHENLIRVRNAREIDQAAITQLIVVDTQSVDRLGAFKNAAARPGVEIHIYDHHPREAGDIEAGRMVLARVGATATLMAEQIRERKLKLSPFEATVLALGIYSDTGSLTFPTTTARDAAAVAYLLSRGANLRVIEEYSDRGLDPAQYGVLTDLLNSIQTYNFSGVKVRVARAKTPEYVPGLSLLAHKLTRVENADIIFALVQMGDRVHVIGRSGLRAVDVARVLERFGGGGHAEAASAVVKGRSLEEVHDDLLLAIGEEAQPAVVASEIMTWPVKTVRPETTMEEAGKIMLRYGHTGLPVVDDEGLVGIISRRDVDKALNHGLGHAPVRGHMSRKLTVAAPDTPLEEIERIIVEEDRGRVPIVKDGQLLGIVTRTDLLRVLYGENHPRWHRTLFRGDGGPEAPRNLAVMMEEKLPPEVYSIIKRVSQAAGAAWASVYLVGGIVRDLLLGVENFDIDLVVEGDGIVFGRLLAAHLGGECRVHREFGTAVVLIPGGPKIDVATARREYYEYAAALPVVERAGLREDLYRRDFTINAMAVRLSEPGFGELVDFFGGQRDLRSKLIRVLYNLSFVEDPTRIFRAVRFAVRYGFAIEEETLQFAREALREGIPLQLSRERIREELVYLLKEPHAAQGIARLADLGVLSALFPEVPFTAESLRVASRVEEVLFRERPGWDWTGVEGWLVYALALFHPLDPTRAEEFCSRLKLPRYSAAVLLEGLKSWRQVLSQLESPEEVSPSAVYALLEPLRAETMVFLLAKAGSEPAIGRLDEFVGKLCGVRLEVSGEDLKRAGYRPGPDFREALDLVRKAKLDGLVSGHEDELKLAADYLKGRLGKEDSLAPDEEE